MPIGQCYARQSQNAGLRCAAITSIVRALHTTAFKLEAPVRTNVALEAAALSSSAFFTTPFSVSLFPEQRKL